MQPPQLEFVMEITASVSKARRVIPITGGTVSGPGIQGIVLPAGADFQVVRPDGTLELTARYVLQTSDGALIYVDNQGLRNGPPELMEKMRQGEAVDPSAIYFRAVPRFETENPAYEWLTRSIFVCTAERFPQQVKLTIYRLC